MSLQKTGKMISLFLWLQVCQTNESLFDFCIQIGHCCIPQPIFAKIDDLFLSQQLTRCPARFWTTQSPPWAGRKCKSKTFKK